MLFEVLLPSKSSSAVGEGRKCGLTSAARVAPSAELPTDGDGVDEDPSGGPTGIAPARDTVVLVVAIVSSVLHPGPFVVVESVVRIVEARGSWPREPSEVSR